MNIGAQSFDVVSGYGTKTNEEDESDEQVDALLEEQDVPS